MTSMSNTSAAGDLVGVQSTPPVHPAFVWEALVQDTQCCIALAEIDGTIRYLNSSEQVCPCGFESCPFVGLSKVTDDLPREQAEQLLACMKRSHESGAPIVLVWFLKGVRARTVVRPVKTDRGALILLTTRSARGVDIADGSQGEGEVVHSLVGDAGPLASLTQRETEVLEMIGRGFSTAKIAETLNRSTKTIEWHRASIGNKLNASNRVELARIAISAGLTSL